MDCPIIKKPIIITIDGPAGSGKSTIAKLLAARLGINYLDTGGMYRAGALAGIERKIDWNHPNELLQSVLDSEIDARDGRTFLAGRDVSQTIRSPEVTAKTRFVADHPEIRALMVEKQRTIAQKTSLVTEGRDQGSLVFPDALCKFFLTATPEERAKRRYQEQIDSRFKVELGTILDNINLRDRQDRARAVGPLVEPTDAIPVDSTGRTVEEVVDEMERIIRNRVRLKGIDQTC